MKMHKLIPVLLVSAFLVSVPVSVSAQDITGETPTITMTPAPTETPVEPVVPEKELRINGNNIYFYVHGKLVKNKWQVYKGAKYYFGSNGKAYKGTQKINNKIYVFDENGHLLQNQKNKMVTVLGRKYYIISKYGHPATGYFIYKNNLYYADSKGRCYQNRSRENGQLYFTANGAAKKNTNALLKMKVMRTVASITNSKMTREQKLRACWNYIVDEKKFNYGGRDPDRHRSNWYREAALQMLTGRTGSCYYFACAFAAMAKEIGYKNIKLWMGYDHCWVTINGLHYDPQAQWTRWILNVYGLSAHPLGSSVDICDFMK